jgi:hypothetical protein
MSDYPHKDNKGRAVWACCGSTIGPVCKHRANVAPCGAEFYTARDARDHESTCGPCAGAVESRTD